MTRHPQHNAPAARRCFFALAVPEKVQQQAINWLQGLPTEARSRQVPKQNHHVTLAFIGNVSAAEIQDLINAINGWQLSAFELCLDRPGLLGNSHYLTWQASQISQAHQQLVTTLRTLCRTTLGAACPVDDFEYLAHLTLRRHSHLGASLPSFGAVQWHCQQFALYQSDLTGDQAQYQVIKSWPLSTY
ncbi:RNA 2',3'-cyclic phosphodiesterase [Motilimonas pumila]|uniref:RNA 2',3'-cyclic phosphodiesterase n=1 Tax=Motilimonas pumila TaxID=2303987 RepID=A0A418YC38_9GAMM|nr:RNA 2',3'-cyclic phosphodiesterase [Motilimonas pumila]RJG42078.1 RNA 2',3'-cyclic phosphodiesterase [Motilimonas pumila]